MYPLGHLCSCLMTKDLYGSHITFLTLCLVVSTAIAQDVASSTRKKGIPASFETMVVQCPEPRQRLFQMMTRGRRPISSDGYLEITKDRLRTPLVGDYALWHRPETRILMRVEPVPVNRKWLSEILPELVRSSTVGAESRVNRFQGREEPKAVTDEISGSRAIMSKSLRRFANDTTRGRQGLCDDRRQCHLHY